MGIFRFPVSWRDLAIPQFTKELVAHLDDRDQALEDFLSNTVAAPAAASGGILACTYYDSTNSWPIPSSFAELDTTNLTVTFDAPASGKVLIVLEGMVKYPSGMNFADEVAWGLIEGGSALVGSAGVVWLYGGTSTSNETRVRHTLSVVVTGISAGTHKYDWSGMRGGGSIPVLVTQHNAGNSTIAGAAVMTVYALP